MDKLEENVDLSQYTSFRIGGKAKYFVEIETVEQLQEVLDWAQKNQEKVFILGSGHNVIFTDSGFDGVVIKIELNGIELTQETEDEAKLKVYAGEDWNEFIDYCLQRNYWGLENLIDIPGTVGAAPVQNIGAFGVEVKNNIEKVEVLNRESLKVETLSNAECEFGYRQSIFNGRLSHKYIILAVHFVLSKTPDPKLDYEKVQAKLQEQDIDDPSIQDIASTIRDMRREKLPDYTEIANCGSFFKNPIISKAEFYKLQNKFSDIKSFDLGEEGVKIPAGWLLDKAGYKGKEMNNIGIWPKQALILYNTGPASYQDLEKTMNTIISDIESKFGIELEPEVNIISN